LVRPLLPVPAPQKLFGLDDFSLGLLVAGSNGIGPHRAENRAHIFPRPGRFTSVLVLAVFGGFGHRTTPEVELPVVQFAFPPMITSFFAVIRNDFGYTQGRETMNDLLSRIAPLCRTLGVGGSLDAFDELEADIMGNLRPEDVSLALDLIGILPPADLWIDEEDLVLQIPIILAWFISG